MRSRWPVLTTLLGIGLAYGAYPYVTLYRLGSAIRSADTATLESLVNWPSVREGIKEDISDLVLDEPSATPDTELPPFGASFMRGIASSAVDAAVTPQALVAATAAFPPQGSEPPRGAGVHVNWAFFDGLATFQVSLSAHGQAEPIRLQMDLRHGHWQIRRVWLPAELLSGEGAKT